jgi:hypothetical protein
MLSGCATRQTPRAATAEAPVSSSADSPQAPVDTPQAATPGQQSIGWATAPLPIASEPVAVKEGSIPLVYLVETPGVFRVRDLTAGRDLAQANAPGRSIVRIDGRAGVAIGGDTLVPGPLDREHRYVIYRDPTGPNLARQGTFQLRPPPKPRPQPSE